MSRKRNKYIHDPNCLSLTHDGDCDCSRPRQLRKPPLTLPQLEAMLTKTFGDDWKNLVIVGPVGDPIRLRDIPEECGFHPAPSHPEGYGLYQINDKPWVSANHVKKMFEDKGYSAWLAHLSKRDVEAAEYISDECVVNNHMKCGDDGVCACECHEEEW